MRRPFVPESAAGPGAALPDSLLAGLMRDTGASVGLLYLMPPGERVLRLVPPPVCPGGSPPLGPASPPMPASPWRTPCAFAVSCGWAARRRSPTATHGWGSCPRTTSCSPRRPSSTRPVPPPIPASGAGPRLYDAKHTLAHTLQTGLLPRTLPRVPGLQVAAQYRPAGRGMDIGGDFYDLIATGPTTAVAAIGDVQGHNTPAAVLMGQLRTAVHAHATADALPGDILSRTNRLLVDLDPGLFASCLIAHLDLTTHRARLATAGHPPALLRVPDRGAHPLHLPPGLLLGIDPEADYPTTEVTLPSGAVLVLYTDGLVETPGVDLDDATSALVARSAEGVPEDADADLDALADALVRYAEESAPRHDDIALLLLRRHDGP